MKTTKYIFVTGGVTSSLGKGIIASSLGKLLQAQGVTVTVQKLDPYLNIDPGTLSPFEHGECFVMDDGTEADLDLGHYERFLNITTSRHNSVTSGRVYYETIMKEREGAFLGKTIQIIPHITDAIKQYILAASENNAYDIVIVEVGGCVGDIESLPFLEAIRQLRWEMGQGMTAVAHLTLLPYIEAANEMKTKPTQHSVKALLSIGLQPDVLICRTTRPIPNYIHQKLSSLCNVKEESVIEAIDTNNIYKVPLLMQEQGLDRTLLTTLNISPSDTKTNLSSWEQFIEQLENAPENPVVKIGLVGKYVTLPDAYKSINEAILHAASKNNCRFAIEYIDSETVHKANVNQKLSHLNGLIVGPGFGSRGISGKITAIQYVRENKIPFFGICLGMQCAAIEFAQNVLELREAASTEYEPNTPHPIIELMKNQHIIHEKGGTMRLGAYECQLTTPSLAHTIYQQATIIERHRHRYEFNNNYLPRFEQAGLLASGINPSSGLVEILELQNHPWFLATQFHPEYKSRVIHPHPLFVAFLAAALKTCKP